MSWQQHTQQPGTDNGLATANHLETQPARLNILLVERQKCDHAKNYIHSACVILHHTSSGGLHFKLQL